MIMFFKWFKSFMSVKLYSFIHIYCAHFSSLFQDILEFLLPLEWDLFSIMLIKSFIVDGYSWKESCCFYALIVCHNRFTKGSCSLFSLGRSPTIPSLPLPVFPFCQLGAGMGWGVSPVNSAEMTDAVKRAFKIIK